jgi:hypothetical protein
MCCWATRRAGVSLIAVVAVSLAAAARPWAVVSSSDPLAFFSPFIQLSADAYQRLEHSEIAVDILPAHGKELAVMVAGCVAADADSFIAAVSDIATLERGAHVPEIHRFSNPPALDDLATLTLDDDGFEAIRHCRVSDCALKLSAEEIAQLHRKLDDRSGNTRSRVEEEFRQLLLRRVTEYFETGERAIARANGADSDAQAVFSTLLKESPYLTSRLPDLARALVEYPHNGVPPGITSFLYWSKEKAWRHSVVSVTLVTIARGDGPDAVVASRDLFALRDTSGSLSVATLMPGPGSRCPHYLAYVDRTWVDGLHALWRPFVNHAARSLAAELFAEARARIEARSQTVRR